MRKFSLSLLVLLLIGGLGNQSVAQLQLLRDQVSGNPVMANPNPDVNGTPYWSGFEEGKIIFSEKDTVENLMIAFNAFNHTLVYQVERDLVAYTPGKISGFILQSKSNPQLFRSGYNIPNIGPNRFVEILVDGKYTLVSHKFKRITDDPGAAYGAQRAKAFVNAEDLYVYKEGQPFLWRAKKKNLIEFFGNEGYQKINQFADTYNLDLKAKSDIRRLIHFLNQEK
ncbi:hypothetical protein [Cecembia rubra]|uniref:Uncharacterized protein n=1 Tax=Cecembia rubra TaxID=1485585 RepID=A0A2P8DX10_9BACT|nr:hypothetical protein [Cecembia rubra]PSL01751.1 hypothetical protein CLV48_11294 [Cecembia rubra]